MMCSLLCRVTQHRQFQRIFDRSDNLDKTGNDVTYLEHRWDIVQALALSFRDLQQCHTPYLNLKNGQRSTGL